MNIRVVEIRPLSSGRPLKAFVDVQVGDWRIYDWRDLDHKVRYRALLSIPDELRQRIEVAILSAWEKESSRNDKT